MNQNAEAHLVERLREAEDDFLDALYMARGSGLTVKIEVLPEEAINGGEVDYFRLKISKSL